MKHVDVDKVEDVEKGSEKDAHVATKVILYNNNDHNQ